MLNNKQNIVDQELFLSLLVHDQNKVAFLEGRFYPVNQKSFQKALIGWKKPAF